MDPERQATGLINHPQKVNFARDWHSATLHGYTMIDRINIQKSNKMEFFILVQTHFQNVIVD